MKLFYGNISEKTAEINEEEQIHILKVLRMRDGEDIYLTDGNGHLAKGQIKIEGKKVKFLTSEIHRNLPKFKNHLHIAIAPTKNIDRIEFFIEKATEMGISEITFLKTENSERKNINLDKLKKQVLAASKQSHRFHFPKINELTKLQDFIKKIDSKNSFVAHCDDSLERTKLDQIADSKNITFLVGPEGDFSINEINMLSENGIKAVTLGGQRLRTETAGIFLAAWNYEKMIK